MHGGSVTAHSDGVGKGSEFVIRLPVQVETEIPVDGASVEHRPVSAAPRVPTGEPVPVLNGFQSSSLGPSVEVGDPVKRRILLADDNSDALESLATLLELGGHEVVTASNGALALECAERHRPEVVLLDIGMPMLDGYEVARRIRVQPWGQKITLVALTGWGQDSDRRRSREAGFDSHLVKPLDMDKLTELLEKLPPSPQAAAPGA
jgi:CheY-like chemotaxis protein